MNVLITGASGFAGSFLAEYLNSHYKYKIHGTYQSEGHLTNLETVRNSITLHKTDLLDKQAINDLVSVVKPDLVFHLAALSSPRRSFENPTETMVNNIDSQLNLLDAIKNNNLKKTRILIVSSAEVYGLVDEKNLPIDEETPFNPTNPYAVSKIAQDFLGLQYYLSFGLKVIRVRPFNHAGPRQTDAFVVSSFCRKISEFEKGRINTIRVGNLAAKRDFTDVRDVVRAYTLVIEKGKEGEVYNLGSGKSYAIQNILDMLIKLSGSSIKVEVDKSLFLPLDNPELVCNAGKFEKLTGWKPEIPLETMLKDTLDYWRHMI